MKQPGQTMSHFGTQESKGGEVWSIAVNVFKIWNNMLQQFLRNPAQNIKMITAMEGNSRFAYYEITCS